MTDTPEQVWQEWEAAKEKVSHLLSLLSTTAPSPEAGISNEQLQTLVDQAGVIPADIRLFFQRGAELFGNLDDAAFRVPIFVPTRNCMPIGMSRSMIDPSSPVSNPDPTLAPFLDGAPPLIIPGPDSRDDRSPLQDGFETRDE